MYSEFPPGSHQNKSKSPWSHIKPMVHKALWDLVLVTPLTSHPTTVPLTLSAPALVSFLLFIHAECAHNFRLFAICCSLCMCLVPSFHPGLFRYRPFREAFLDISTSSFLSLESALFYTVPLKTSLHHITSIMLIYCLPNYSVSFTGTGLQSLHHCIPTPGI